MSFAKRQQLEELQQDPGYIRDMEEQRQQEEMERDDHLKDYADRVKKFLDSMKIDVELYDSQFIALRETYSNWIWVTLITRN